MTDWPNVSVVGDAVDIDPGGVGGRRDGDRVCRLRDRGTGDCRGEFIAGARLIEAQPGEGGDAVFNRCSQVATKGCVVGVGADGDRDGSGCDGVPLAVIDLDLEAKGLVGTDG